MRIIREMYTHKAMWLSIDREEDLNSRGETAVSEAAEKPEGEYPGPTQR